MHLKKRDFSVRRGEKRRNTGYVFRAFSTKHDGKISFFRLPDPYLACPKGQVVFIHKIHLALSQILQVCRRDVVFHVIPGKIVVEYRVDLGNRLFLFLLPFILSGLIFLLFRHEDHLKHRIPIFARKNANKKARSGKSSLRFRAFCLL